MTIPKILWQCSRFEYQDLPTYILDYMNSWKKLNPDWTFNYFSDRQCKEYIEKELGTEYAAIYDSIERRDLRGDFWRYLAIRNNGGFYADVDAKCTSPIEDWADLNKSFVVTKNTYPETGPIWEQWCFGAEPNHPMMIELVAEVLDNVKGKKQIGVHETFFPFTKCVERNLPNESIQTILPSWKMGVFHIAAHDNWYNPQYWR